MRKETGWLVGCSPPPLPDVQICDFILVRDSTNIDNLPDKRRKWMRHVACINQISTDMWRRLVASGKLSVDCFPYLYFVKCAG